MKNLTIAHRVLMMIGTSVLALLVVGFIGLSVANKESESIRNIDEVSIESIQTLVGARQAFMEARGDILQLFVNADESEIKKLTARIKVNGEEILKGLKTYEDKYVSSDEDKKLLQTETQYVTTYINLFNNDILASLGDTSGSSGVEYAAQVFKIRGVALGNKVMAAFDAHIAYNNKQVDATVSDAYASAARGKNISLGAIAVGVLVVGLLGAFLLINIRASLNQIETMVGRVEKDLDFTLRVETKRRDEIGRTTVALNRLLDKLQGSLKSIAAGAQSVSTAAAQMSELSAGVATSSGQQSEAASNMAVTVEEITVSVNHVADRALETRRLAEDSGQMAKAGEQVIGQTASNILDISHAVRGAAERIHDLEKHSSQIASVVQVIKDIADQTNLLALNAAIEAARAGEQGRGFAVVADEVRKLAERTSVSTTEIARTIELIRNSTSDAVTGMEGVVQKVALGVEKAQEANESIRQIGASANGAVHMIGDIAEAIREQGSATNNIAVQVERIAQMSEASSAVAEKGAQAAKELDLLSGEMMGIVKAYRL